MWRGRFLWCWWNYNGDGGDVVGGGWSEKRMRGWGGGETLLEFGCGGDAWFRLRRCIGHGRGDGTGWLADDDG